MLELAQRSITGFAEPLAVDPPHCVWSNEVAEGRQELAEGAQTATLQASPDGRGVYERLGFRTLTTLRAST